MTQRRHTLSLYQIEYIGIIASFESDGIVILHILEYLCGTLQIYTEELGHSDIFLNLEPTSLDSE